jgi:hypothetical protein
VAAPRRTCVGLRVAHARDEDLTRWRRSGRGSAPARQLAPVLDAERLAAWVRGAPGLAVHDYLVARRADGRIAGFVALWDQRAVQAAARARLPAADGRRAPGGERRGGADRQAAAPRCRGARCRRSRPCTCACRR